MNQTAEEKTCTYVWATSCIEQMTNLNDLALRYYERVSWDQVVDICY